MPYFDSNNRSVIYFETPAMPNGTHTVNVTVTWCNETNPYILDYVLVESPQGAIDSGVETTRMAPSSTPTIVPIVITQPIPVGAIVGGVVGGITTTAILVFVAYYFLIRGPRDRRSHYFKRPGAADILAGEGLYGYLPRNVYLPKPVQITSGQSTPPRLARLSRPPALTDEDASLHS